MPMDRKPIFIDQPVRMVMRKLCCKKCGSTNLKTGDSVMMTYPPQYELTCRNCGHTFTSFSQPTIMYYEDDGEKVPIYNENE